MVRSTHLRFNSHIGKQKPFSIDGPGGDCPFCDRGSLVGILEERHPALWLENKYPVLQDTFQTVLIETDECHAELSTYSKDHLHMLIRFGVEKWQEMSQSSEFRSVAFYKNHGPQSGGSLRHPHMQIVGLHSLDYQEHVTDEQFEGIVIERKPGVIFNLSSHPRVGFTEFNVLLDDLAAIDQLADYIQVAAHYVVHHLNRHYQSYNLFFYQRAERVVAKIVPRFVVSPFFVGYSIPQVTNRIEEIAQEVRTLYLADDKAFPSQAKLL